MKFAAKQLSFTFLHFFPGSQQVGDPEQFYMTKGLVITDILKHKLHRSMSLAFLCLFAFYQKDMLLFLTIFW